MIQLVSNRSEHVAIIGTGIIGAGMATLLIGNGFETLVIGRSEKGCQSCFNEIRANLDELVAERILDELQVSEYLTHLRISMDYSMLHDRTVVFEAVQEKPEFKQYVYQIVETLCGKDTLIISTTSSMSPDDLAKGLSGPDRLIVAHPWNPPHLVPCVEVVRGGQTSDLTAERTVTLLKSLGKEVILLKKTIEGFIGNRIQHAMFREALNLIEQGVATPQEIDDTILFSFGPRYASIGLMEYYDSVGLDLQIDVEKYLFPTLCNATEPQKPLRERFDAGHLGPKSGQGFYDWTDKDKTDFRRRKNRAYYQYVNWPHQDNS